MKLNSTIIAVGLLIAFIAVIVACNNNTNTPQKQKSAAVDSVSTDTAASCESPSSNRYPNEDKPMALMMRQMADNAQKMKNKLEAGEKINASEFPFIRFHLVEPTDPNVLQPQFYENARTFQESHKALVNAPQAKQKQMYTAYINQCINCHQTYCSGPLKRIRKLVLN